MNAIDDLVTDNLAYSQSSSHTTLAKKPSRCPAVVACMDSRLDPFAALGLAHGEAHIIRDAGGVVTEDVIRSLLVSQRLLATRAVMLVQHTDCGLSSATTSRTRADRTAPASAHEKYLKALARRVADLDRRAAANESVHVPPGERRDVTWAFTTDEAPSFGCHVLKHRPPGDVRPLRR